MDEAVCRECGDTFNPACMTCEAYPARRGYLTCERCKPATPALTPGVRVHLRDAAAALMRVSALWGEADQAAFDADGRMAEVFGMSIDEAAAELARFTAPT